MARYGVEEVRIYFSVHVVDGGREYFYHLDLSISSNDGLSVLFCRTFSNRLFLSWRVNFILLVFLRLILTVLPDRVPLGLLLLLLLLGLVSPIERASCPPGGVL